MLLHGFWQQFSEKALATPSTPDLFNQYRDEDPGYDCPGAARQRRENLRNYLAAFEVPPPVFILAEAPGPWGCRFSGIPVTSEAQLVSADIPVHGQKTSVKSKPHTEYTARIFWRELRSAFPKFLVWNAVPLHPHYEGHPMSIRTPRKREVRAFTPLLAGLLQVLQPETVLAMGRTAEGAFEYAGWHSEYVRHPSQGGANIFAESVRRVMYRYLM